jgi:hypothetical protein
MPRYKLNQEERPVARMYFHRRMISLNFHRRPVGHYFRRVCHYGRRGVP